MAGVSTALWLRPLLLGGYPFWLATEEVETGFVSVNKLTGVSLQEGRFLSVLASRHDVRQSSWDASGKLPW